METVIAPILAAPGAGLPAPELFIARLLFGWQRITGSRSAFNARFNAERLRIRELVAACGPDHASKRVLIKRLPGMEDSSRDWSVWMTLDHLRIVNTGIARSIELLGRDQAPKEAASTAKVKPSPAVMASVVQDYEDSCDRVMSAAAGVPNLKTAARHTHPWFGPLDAYGWHALVANHMGIHRAQIEAILRSFQSAEPETN